MATRMEEIIFTEHCGIDLDGLGENRVVDPSRIKVSPELNRKIIESVKEEYPGLDELEVNLILLQYGANVDPELEGCRVELMDGYIKC